MFKVFTFFQIDPVLPTFSRQHVNEHLARSPDTEDTSVQSVLNTTFTTFTTRGEYNANYGRDRLTTASKPNDPSGATTPPPKTDDYVTTV